MMNFFWCTFLYIDPFPQWNPYITAVLKPFLTYRRVNATVQFCLLSLVMLSAYSLAFFKHGRTESTVFLKSRQIYVSLSEKCYFYQMYFYFAVKNPREFELGLYYSMHLGKLRITGPHSSTPLHKIHCIFENPQFLTTFNFQVLIELVRFKGRTTNLYV